MDVGAVARWVNWSFDAGRQFQAQKYQEAHQYQQQNALNSINMDITRNNVNVMNSRANVQNGMVDGTWQNPIVGASHLQKPPGLYCDGQGGGRAVWNSQNRHALNPPEGKCGPTKGEHSRGGKGTMQRTKGKGKTVKGRKGGSVRSAGTQSNASSKGSFGVSQSTIKNASRQRSDVGGAFGSVKSLGVAMGPVSAHREDKRERLEHVKALLGNPENVLPGPNLLVNDSEVKQELRKKACELWERLDGALDEGPNNPEYGFEEEAIRMDRMGKEFLRMARAGGHFSAGKVVQVWTRQVEQTGRSGRENFDPGAYVKAAQRYSERRRCHILQ